jgi:hypothetical protein
MMEDHGHGWRAVRSGRSLRIGTEVRVVVTSVNPIEGLIDLDLVPEGGAADNAVPKPSKETKSTRDAKSTKDAKGGRERRR